MLYLKILKDGETVAAEAHESPQYVKQKNRLLLRCSEREAQGILSLDSAVVYQLDGKEAIQPPPEYTSCIITMAEYDEISDKLGGNDEEDNNPEVPPDTEETEILTRAELTEKVIALEEKLLATEILLGVSE